MKQTHPIAENDIDTEPLLPDILTLTQTQIRWAIHLSETLPSEAQKWQAYLSGLALFTLQEWLQQRSPNLKIKTQIGIHKASSPCIQVNQFRIHLLTLNSLPDSAIAIPKQVLQSNNPPDFYVLVEVHEEIQRSRICGYLCHDQRLQQKISLHPSSPNNLDYQVPLHWFDFNPDNLLLLLRCLKAFPNQQLQIEYQTKPNLLINVARWFKNELGGVATSSNWRLLPPLALGAMRSRSAAIYPDSETLLQELVQSHNIAIPAQAHSTHHNIKWQLTSNHSTTLRLRTMAWEASTLDSRPEWMLLLILSAQPGTILPAGLRLQVRDAAHLLTDLPLEQPSPERHLYTQVSGRLDEQFWVTLYLDSSTSLTLAPVRIMDIINHKQSLDLISVPHSPQQKLV